MSSNRSLSLLVFVGIAVSACSAYVDSDRKQCKADPDCDALGSAYVGYECRESLCQPRVAPVDMTWACLDAMGPPETVTGSVHVVLTMVDLLSQRPLAGVSLALCNKLDGDCALPITTYQSGVDGKLDVEMPVGFDGYFQAEGAGIYPTLIFPPSTRKQRAPGILPMVPASFVGMMFKGIGATVAADRSMILTTALDCLGRPAAGVTLASPQADAQTVSYVLAGGLPSRTPLITDESGGGGLVNIPAGGVLINSMLAASNRPIGTVGVQTRPGHLTMVLITPSGG